MGQRSRYVSSEGVKVSIFPAESTRAAAIYLGGLVRALAGSTFFQVELQYLQAELTYASSCNFIRRKALQHFVNFNEYKSLR